MGSIDLLLDTNVLVEIWRGKSEPANVISRYYCGLETITCLEFLQGVNHKQRQKADAFLAEFEFIPFAPEISFRALSLIRAYSHRNGMRMADALIAATALETEIALFTFNARHFNFIEGLKLI